MKSSNLPLAIVLLLCGLRLDAKERPIDIHGRIELHPDSGARIKVTLELRDQRTGRTMAAVPLNPDSQRPYWFSEPLPDHLKAVDLLVYVVVSSPAGYASSSPDYFRKGGTPLVFKPLSLEGSTTAYAAWMRAARDAERDNYLNLAIRRLEHLEDFDLNPDQRLQITIRKAVIYDRARQWKRQQELLRDAFPISGFRDMTTGLIADYFRIRFRGFSALVTGDLPGAILQRPELQDLWEQLVSDFARQYSSCELDQNVSSDLGELTADIIRVQYKTIRTWLGKPGTTVNECAPSGITGDTRAPAGSSPSPDRAAAPRPRPRPSA